MASFLPNTTPAGAARHARVIANQAKLDEFKLLAQKSQAEAEKHPANIDYQIAAAQATRVLTDWHAKIIEEKASYLKSRQDRQDRQGKDQPSICMYYLRGNCRKENCQFAHEAASAANEPRSERSICKFYKQGNCTKGEKCSFSHVADESRSKRSVCKFYKQGNCAKGEKCSFSHDAAQNNPDNTTNPPKRFICKFFKQGNCTKGEECRFSHDDAATVSDEAATASDEAASSAAESDD